MLCKKPFVRGVQIYGCGQCMPCRLNRRRIWTHRIMLEAMTHPAASFVTLTYNEENLPDGGTLVPEHLQLWLKRLRKNFGPCRFYAVGEYGDLSWRPHYHVALFGYGGREAEVACARTWINVATKEPLGYTYVGDLTFHSASYIAGYVTKKMTRRDDVRLDGRFPEFARMSLRPGIGAKAMEKVAEALCNKHGWRSIENSGDVPGVLKHGTRDFPLGRYLARRLRGEMNFAEVGCPEEITAKREAEVLAMYKDYLANKENALSVKDMYTQANRVKVERVEKRAKIFQQGKRI